MHGLAATRRLRDVCASLTSARRMLTMLVLPVRLTYSFGSTFFPTSISKTNYFNHILEATHITVRSAVNFIIETVENGIFERLYVGSKSVLKLNRSAAERRSGSFLEAAAALRNF